MTGITATVHLRAMNANKCSNRLCCECFDVELVVFCFSDAVGTDVNGVGWSSSLLGAPPCLQLSPACPSGPNAS